MSEFTVGEFLFTLFCSAGFRPGQQRPLKKRLTVRSRAGRDCPVAEITRSCQDFSAGVVQASALSMQAARAGRSAAMAARTRFDLRSGVGQGLGARHGSRNSGPAIARRGLKPAEPDQCWIKVNNILVREGCVNEVVNSACRQFLCR